MKKLFAIALAAVLVAPMTISTAMADHHMEAEAAADAMEEHAEHAEEHMEDAAEHAEDAAEHMEDHAEEHMEEHHEEEAHH